mmetsp:Transcript_43924/g.73166  ORF Transcript_43924/g.73166 Transcript_43924/m.73166 type:complete len:241 (+) Transcript_43924:93-815(+)
MPVQNDPSQYWKGHPTSSVRRSMYTVTLLTLCGLLVLFITRNGIGEIQDVSKHHYERDSSFDGSDVLEMMTSPPEFNESSTVNDATPAPKKCEWEGDPGKEDELYPGFCELLQSQTEFNDSKACKLACCEAEECNGWQYRGDTGCRFSTRKHHGWCEPTAPVKLKVSNRLISMIRMTFLFSSRHGMDGVSKNESPPTNASGKRKYHLSKIILCLFATTTTTTTTHLQKRILLPVLPSNYY